MICWHFLYRIGLESVAWMFYETFLTYVHGSCNSFTSCYMILNTYAIKAIFYAVLSLCGTTKSGLFARCWLEWVHAMDPRSTSAIRHNRRLRLVQRCGAAALQGAVGGQHGHRPAGGGSGPGTLRPITPERSAHRRGATPAARSPRTIAAGRGTRHPRPVAQFGEPGQAHAGAGRSPAICRHQYAVT